jgi:hypothetical protein
MEHRNPGDSERAVADKEENSQNQDVVQYVLPEFYKRR